MRAWERTCAKELVQKSLCKRVCAKEFLCERVFVRNSLYKNLMPWLAGCLNNVHMYIHTLCIHSIIPPKHVRISRVTLWIRTHTSTTCRNFRGHAAGHVGKSYLWGWQGVSTMWLHILVLWSLLPCLSAPVLRYPACVYVYNYVCVCMCVCIYVYVERMGKSYVYAFATSRISSFTFLCSGAWDHAFELMYIDTMYVCACMKYVLWYVLFCACLQESCGTDTYATVCEHKMK